MKENNIEKTAKNTEDEKVIIVEKPGLVKRAVASYTHVFRKTISHVPGSIKNTKKMFSGMFGRAKKTNEIWEANKNDPDLPLLEKDFNNVMIKWGVNEDEIEGVAKYYRSHSLSGGLGVLLLLFFLIINLVNGSPFYYLASIFVLMFASGFLCVTSYWRYKVLTIRHFQPFFKWINS